MTDELMKTPLHDTHVAFGARMVDFAGWSMPLLFRGIIDEHNHTRTACSVFDVSHMGRLKLSGGDSGALLDRLCTRNLAEPEVGRSYYTHMCNEDGGILDDLIVSRFETHWGIVCNASNREKIVNWINGHVGEMDATLTDETAATAMIALQGPRALALAQELTGIDPATIKRYWFTTHELLDMRITVYRCGYTGEDGLEIVFPSGLAGLIVPRVLGTTDTPHPVIKPAGLGARDTLRIEAGMPLYGHELSEDVDSITAGQGWCVDLETDFIGAAAMRRRKEMGLASKLVGLELAGKRTAREHYKVLSGAEHVGDVTSGVLSPTQGKSLAMAYVSIEHADEGARLEVEFGGKRVAATVVPLPFYRRRKEG